ncbi:DUF4097 family beta strand repeat protein [candidate division KSB1 bacterium]|nr:DUF4097 family beta strand repeat protein [candidate division KSB1 bacterium]
MLSHIYLNAKRAAYLAALACTVWFAACDFRDITDPDAGGNFSATESFSFEVQAAGNQHFRLEGINGALDVVGVPGAQTVRIWGERTVRSHSTSDARSYLREVEVRVSDSNDELLVQTLQPEDTHGREVEVNYHIRVPADWNVELHNANGLAWVDSLQANVYLQITNGQVQGHVITGAFEVELTNGNVLLKSMLGSAHVTVVNGNVDAEMILAATGKCEMSTVNGNINLALPKNTSAQFTANVTNGSIAVVELPLQNAVTSSNSVRGQLGKGEGKVALATINGTIRAAGF